MKPALLKNIESTVGSLTVQRLEEPYFDPNWHFHPHYQLFTVLAGAGTRLIGDSIQHFEAGDTVFLGPDLPHLWRSEAGYFEKDSSKTTDGIVLYFQEDFLTKDFLQKPEMRGISHLLSASNRGLVYTGETRQTILAALENLLHYNDFNRTIKTLELLNLMAHCSDVAPITSYGYVNNHKVSETERMQKVHSYVLQHFREEITLREAAALAGMSEPAFCRYFRARANKTFTDFVNEIRIGHACKSLVEGSGNISEIAYQSGFETLSNFNRNFKKIVRQTPRDYRSTYRTTAA